MLSDKSLCSTVFSTNLIYLTNISKRNLKKNSLGKSGPNPYISFNISRINRPIAIRITLRPIILFAHHKVFIVSRCLKR